jgi:hypothetical protein
MPCEMRLHRSVQINAEKSIKFQDQSYIIPPPQDINRMIQIIGTLYNEHTVDPAILFPIRVLAFSSPLILQQQCNPSTICLTIAATTLRPPSTFTPQICNLEIHSGALYRLDPEAKSRVGG